jgi:hypothetical protein
VSTLAVPALTLTDRAVATIDEIDALEAFA